MKIIKSFRFISSLFLVCTFFNYGCAKSKYVDEIALTRQNNELTSGNCNRFFQGQGLCVDYRWDYFPPIEEFGSMILTFYLATDSSVLQSPQTEVKVKLYMPSMGHGSSPVTVTEISPGVFRADDICFTMGGDWEIYIQLQNAQGQIIEQQTISLLI